MFEIAYSEGYRGSVETVVLEWHGLAVALPGTDTPFQTRLRHFASHHLQHALRKVYAADRRLRSAVPGYLDAEVSRSAGDV